MRFNGDRRIASKKAASTSRLPNRVHLLVNHAGTFDIVVKVREFCDRMEKPPTREAA